MSLKNTFQRIMKSLYLCFFLVYLCHASYAQHQDTLKIDTTVTHSLKVKDTLAQIKPNKKDSIANVWLTEFWDTSTYNPYKNTIKRYPFNIVFADSVYGSPIERKKVVTSRYGWRNRRPHKGIDIDLVTGDNVLAMLDGKVRYVSAQAGHGKLVVIRHFNGLETVYAHLSKQLVNVNDRVSKGQIIGKGGTTGNARGSHLHLEVSFKGVYIYPEYIFNFGEKNKIRSQNIWVTKSWATPYLHSSKRQSLISICNTYEEALQSEKKQKQIYIVKKGDTLSKISYKHHVSINSICKTNAIRKTSTLKIGQKLVLVH
jgi:murein DD-endopeptidase MepM/ murein hydrolase activator NlpD